MPKDLSHIIRSLQTTAVNRCRERLDQAAIRSRDLVRRDGDSGDGASEEKDTEYGVTSVLKRRHGL